MHKMKELLARLWADESGISSVEYALLLAFIAAGIILGAEVLSEAVEGQLLEAATCISGGSANCPAIP